MYELVFGLHGQVGLLYCLGKDAIVGQPVVKLKHIIGIAPKQRQVRKPT